MQGNSITAWHSSMRNLTRSLAVVACFFCGEAHRPQHGHLQLHVLIRFFFLLRQHIVNHHDISSDASPQSFPILGLFLPRLSIIPMESLAAAQIAITFVSAAWSPLDGTNSKVFYPLKPMQMQIFAQTLYSKVSSGLESERSKEIRVRVRKSWFFSPHLDLA